MLCQAEIVEQENIVCDRQSRNMKFDSIMAASAALAKWRESFKGPEAPRQVET